MLRHFSAIHEWCRYYLVSALIARTSQSVIARLENADYEGRPLTILKRIAEKLGRQGLAANYSDALLNALAF